MTEVRRTEAGLGFLAIALLIGAGAMAWTQERESPARVPASSRAPSSMRLTPLPVSESAIGTVSATDPRDEMPFFPSGLCPGIIATGRPTLAADGAWIATVQYYGKHHLGDRKYPLARRLFDVVTRDDPRFRNAYLFGALVLGEEANDMPGARFLLRRGIEANPSDWMLPFERGFLESMHGDLGIGASEMERASRMQGAPAFTARLAAHARARARARARDDFSHREGSGS